MTLVQGLKAMIVEDQAILAMELEIVLTEAGHTVVGCAMDLTGAMTLVERISPEVALVDVNLLDGFTGPEVARMLIEDHATTVIFLTANPEQIPHDLSGVLGSVAKPFDERAILEALAFAGRYRQTGEITAVPRRFRLAQQMV